MHNNDVIPQINCFAIHSHADEHIRCKIKEEAISPQIFINFFLTQTQIFTQTLTPNLFLSAVLRYFQLNLHYQHIGRSSIQCELSMDAWSSVMQRL